MNKMSEKNKSTLEANHLTCYNLAYKSCRAFLKLCELWTIAWLMRHSFAIVQTENCKRQEKYPMQFSVFPKLNLVEGNSSLCLTSEMLLNECISECTQKPKVFDEAEAYLPSIK